MDVIKIAPENYALAVNGVQVGQFSALDALAKAIADWADGNDDLPDPWDEKVSVIDGQVQPPRLLAEGSVQFVRGAGTSGRNVFTHPKWPAGF